MLTLKSRIPCGRFLVAAALPLAVVALQQHAPFAAQLESPNPISSEPNRGSIGDSSTTTSNVGQSSSTGTSMPKTSYDANTFIAKVLLSRSSCNQRNKLTDADRYYQQHKRIPLPDVMHKVLDRRDTRNTPEDGSVGNLLVIGDVHGCLDDLLRLHKQAVSDNGNVPFDCVILVGDLVNKGPQSAEVVRFVRTQENWLSVRGNHDNASLAAALGDKGRRRKAKYQWALQGEHASIQAMLEPSTSVTLNDHDIEWLAQLPYTITIPAKYFKKNDGIDTVIVHAGFVPGVEIQNQSVQTMITVREVDYCSDCVRYKYHDRKVHPDAAETDSETSLQKHAWASVWTGPQRVIFGHDARRGIQTYPGDMAIGIDSGAVYGNRLTGIVLPERKLVSIKTRQHCATCDKDD